MYTQEDIDKAMDITKLSADDTVEEVLKQYGPDNVQTQAAIAYRAGVYGSARIFTKVLKAVVRHRVTGESGTVAELSEEE